MKKDKDTTTKMTQMLELSNKDFKVAIFFNAQKIIWTKTNRKIKSISKGT